MQDCWIHLAQKLHVPCLHEFPVRNVQVESSGDGVAEKESVAVVGVELSVMVGVSVVVSDCAIDSGTSRKTADPTHWIILHLSID